MSEPLHLHMQTDRVRISEHVQRLTIGPLEPYTRDRVPGSVPCPTPTTNVPSVHSIDTCANRSLCLNSSAPNASQCSSTYAYKYSCSTLWNAFVASYSVVSLPILLPCKRAAHTHTHTARESPPLGAYFSSAQM
eukprot:3069133-Pyramimonas_sp.AAC.1